MKHLKFALLTLALCIASQAGVMAQIEGVTAPDCIEFRSGTNVKTAVEITTSKRGVTLEPCDAWFGIAGEAKLGKRQKRRIHLWAEPNFSTKERESTLRLTAADGSQQEIRILQKPYLTKATEAASARLMLQRNAANAAHTADWEPTAICSTADGSGWLAVVATHGRPPLTEVANGLDITGLERGDYLLFVLPNQDIKAGTYVDFCGTLTAMDELAPSHFIVEYWDGDRWQATNREPLRRTSQGEPYTFYNKYFRSAHYTTFMESFRLANGSAEGIKVRLRVVRGGTGRTNLAARSAYVAMQLVHHRHIDQMHDSRRMLFIGNSFTYYFGTPFMLQEIAASQGHHIEGTVSIKGGQDFAEHLALERSIEAIERGGYDYALLQDTSPNAAKYAATSATDIRTAARRINDLTLKHSPSCKILYEHTWACPYKDFRGYGSRERLDKLLYEGIHRLAREMGDVWGVSPIGEGFRRGHKANMPLLHRDNRHQSPAGAYMKACINYLYIYGGTFDANVSECGIDPKTAAAIRHIATEVVSKARRAEQQKRVGDWGFWCNFQ